MAPKKLQSRRKKQKTTEASTSEAPVRDLLSDKEYAKERRQKLEEMELYNHHYLDWSLLRDYGMQERIRAAVQDQTWFKLFEINEPAHRDITIEFLSTMIIERHEHYPTMQFQAYGQIHTIELRQISYFLGLIDEDDEDAEALPQSWPEGISAEQFWFQLIHPRRDDFVPSKSLNTTFAAMEHKLLHHIISHTICSKKTSHSKVTSFDIFYLYCMTSGYQIDIGMEVASFLDRQVADTRTQFIMCGGYITALLKGMLIFQTPEGDQGIECKRISSGPFRAWGLHKVDARIAPPRAAEEIQEPPPTDRASTSHPPSSESPYDKLEANIQEIHKNLKKERKKNKKFRTTLFTMLKSVVSCFHPDSAAQLHYQTSSDETSSADSES